MLKYEINTHLDDPNTTIKHRDIILGKPFLKRIYVEWYGNFIEFIKTRPTGKFLEIGSGGGFLKDLAPQVTTSDIMPLPSCDMELSAEELPFENESLDGIFMINVLHHIPNPEKFFAEAERTLKKGGKIIMVEPVNTLLSRFIYKNLHHEPFDPEGGWTIDSTGPLSGANGALPWIFMKRDKEKFATRFPHLKIENIKPHTAFRYTVSGGVSRKLLVPAFTFGLWKAIESLPLMNTICGMFGTYTVVKN